MADVETEAREGLYQINEVLKEVQLGTDVEYAEKKLGTRLINIRRLVGWMYSAANNGDMERLKPYYRLLEETHQRFQSVMGGLEDAISVPIAVEEMFVVLSRIGKKPNKPKVSFV